MTELIAWLGSGQALQAGRNLNKGSTQILIYSVSIHFYAPNPILLDRALISKIYIFAPRNEAKRVELIF